jgi:hypothetical protein
MDIRTVLEDLVSVNKQINDLSDSSGLPRLYEDDPEIVRNMYVDDFLGENYPEEEKYFLSMRVLFDELRGSLGNNYYFVEETASRGGDGTDPDFWTVYLAKRIETERKDHEQMIVYDDQVVRVEFMDLFGEQMNIEFMDDEDRKIGNILEKIKCAYDIIEKYLVAAHSNPRHSPKSE